MPGMWVFKPAHGDDPKLASMNSHQGRQTWVWDPSAGTPEQEAAAEAARAKFTSNRLKQRHSSDELLRIQAAERIAAAAAAGDVPPQPPPAAGDAPLDPSSVAAGLRGAIGYYQALQCDDGHFPGDYGGPMFLMPGLLITLYTCGVLDDVLPKETHQREMRRYLLNHQNADGGFGLHVEGSSTMFGTALSYVSLRLLGMKPGDKEVLAAKKWMHERGGATYITSWWVVEGAFTANPLRGRRRTRSPPPTPPPTNPPPN
jgi:cycloartenol synthase